MLYISNSTVTNPTFQESIQPRDFRSTDMGAFVHDLNNKLKPWLELDKVNNQVMFYNNAVRQILNDHCPLRTTESSIQPRAPWYTSSIHEARRVKCRLECRWRKTKRVVDRDAYKSYLSVLSDLITSAKASYFKDKLSASSINDIH